MGRGSYRAESWIFSRFVLSMYFFIAFQIPFTLGISSNLGGKTRSFCLQIFSKSTLWSAKRGNLNRKWKTVSSSSPHSQSGESVLPILWRCYFSRQWPVRTCVISCWMNLFFKHATSLWCGKNCRVREPVVQVFQSCCHTSSREDLALAVSRVRWPGEFCW